MLVAEYLVGREEATSGMGKPVCLLVNSVLPTDCEPGRVDIVRRRNRKDLIIEYLQEDEPVAWINLPDLPNEVVELLESGGAIPLIDESDMTRIDCKLEPLLESAKGKVMV